MRRYCTTGMRVLVGVAPTVFGALLFILTPDTAAGGLLLVVIILNGALVAQTRMVKRFLADVRADLQSLSNRLDRADRRAELDRIGDRIDRFMRPWSSRRALNRADARELARLRNEGKTWRELAEMFGVSEKTAKRTYDAETGGVARKD